MPQGIVVCLAFRHLFIIVIFEGGVVLYNIVRCIDGCVPEHLGAVFGHPGASGLVVVRRIDRRVQTGESKQLIGVGEMVYVRSPQVSFLH